MKVFLKRIAGFRRMVLAPGARALVIDKGRFTDILASGEHWVPGRPAEILVLNPSRALFSNVRQEDLLREAPELVAKHFNVVTTDVAHVAVVEVDGKVEAVLDAEERALFWKDFGELTVTHHALGEVPKLDPKLAARLVRAGFDRHLIHVTVPEGSVGLMAMDGVAHRMLSSGKHSFWKTEALLTVKVVDTRLRTLDVTGQEILTKNRVPLRVNITAMFRVVDPELATSVVSDHMAALHVALQLAFRKTLGAMTLDQLLADKVSVDAEAAGKVRSEMAAIGLEVGEIALKDVILPGEVREILNQVVMAEKEAEANVIRRREETNATRSLLNTAKVMAENPVMLRLKELEALENIASKVETLTVHNGTEGLMTEVVNLRDL